MFKTLIDQPTGAKVSYCRRHRQRHFVLGGPGRRKRWAPISTELPVSYPERTPVICGWPCARRSWKSKYCL